MPCGGEWMLGSASHWSNEGVPGSRHMRRDQPPQDLPLELPRRLPPPSPPSKPAGASRAEQGRKDAAYYSDYLLGNVWASEGLPEA